MTIDEDDPVAATADARLLDLVGGRAYRISDFMTLDAFRALAQGLTPREAEALLSAGLGHSAEATALELRISRRTVEKHFERT